jgi:hypothetical protein
MKFQHSDVVVCNKTQSLYWKFPNKNQKFYVVSYYSDSKMEITPVDPDEFLFTTWNYQSGVGGVHHTRYFEGRKVKTYIVNPQHFSFYGLEENYEFKTSFI